MSHVPAPGRVLPTWIVRSEFVDLDPHARIERQAEFDAWLATVKADVWDEGWRNATSYHPDKGRITDNPYRSAT